MRRCDEVCGGWGGGWELRVLGGLAEWRGWGLRLNGGGCVAAAEPLTLLDLCVLQTDQVPVAAEIVVQYETGRGSKREEAFY